MNKQLIWNFIPKVKLAIKHVIKLEVKDVEKILISIEVIIFVTNHLKGP